MNPRNLPEDNPIGHLTSPIVTGGSVIGVKCKEGVLLAADTLLSYGSLLSISFLSKNITMFVDFNKSLTS